MALILKTKQGSINSLMIQTRTFGPEFPDIRQFTRNLINGKVNKKIKINVIHHLIYPFFLKGSN